MNYQVLNNMVAIELITLRPFVYQRVSLGSRLRVQNEEMRFSVHQLCRFSFALRPCKEMFVNLGTASMRIRDPREAVGGMREYLTKREIIEGCQVESICCNNSWDKE
jgi:hypothetical protein